MNYENVYMDELDYVPKELSSPVYYKIIKKFGSNAVTIACLQDFDEIDYDQDDFFKDSKSRCICFYSEENAIQYMNEKFKYEFIDERYRQNLENSIFKGMLK